MHTRLQRGIRLWLNKSALSGAPLAGLALIVLTSGCAGYRPVPLLIEGPASKPLLPTSAHNPSFKLITYNIWGLPSWMTGARPGRYQQIARELKRLDPDVVLLQEAWTTEARGCVPARGPWAIARAASQHTFLQQCGLVTLSKFPIVGGQFYPFHRAAMPDRLVNKGVLKVTVQTGNGDLVNIWNVHLQEGGSPIIRHSQVRELVARVESAEDGQVADIVGGDFNCTPDSSLYGELAYSFGPRVQEPSDGKPFVTWDGLSAKEGEGRTLDHVFIRKRAILPVVKAKTQVAFSAPRKERLSDHLGIEATINLINGPVLAGPIHAPSRRQPFPEPDAAPDVLASGD